MKTMKNMIQHLQKHFRQRAQQHEDGFTLVEMTVVVTMIGLLMPLITGILYTALNAQNAVVKTTNGQLSGQAIEAALHEDIAHSTWLEYAPETHGNNFNNYDYLALHVASGECVAWAEYNGELRRTVYPRSNGPTLRNFNADGLPFTNVSEEATSNVFEVSPNGAVNYTFTLDLDGLKLEVSDSVTPVVAQNTGKAEGTCF